MANEPDQAAWWRRNVVKLGPDVLSAMTGYSEEAIFYFEKGCTRKGKPHKTKAWLRWKMACAGVDAIVKGNRVFSWGIK
jgi:hypothetical protein